MTEIFTNITDDMKLGAQLIFDSAIKNNNPIKMVEILNDYTEHCATEEEREFVAFYFNMRMRQLIDESDNDER